ncbi:hypothetical protein DPMN_188584 [Dreissena polymorpha]|uniref:Uncharacterized protein n=1 Tax=Dreissena polymorpha TaxID=45954 RepID=A0A9D4DSD4_DREPO|nr:hypothetical protein DPMN_188584 [Dreissena polymorpha]
MEAHPLRDTDIDLLWEVIIGTESPKGLVKYNLVEQLPSFRLARNHGAVQFATFDSVDSNGVDYIELNERQTKTRTGENIADIRKVSLKMFGKS